MTGIISKAQRERPSRSYFILPFFSSSCDTKLASSVSLILRSTVYDVLTVMPGSPCGNAARCGERTVLDDVPMLLTPREWPERGRSRSSLLLPYL
jgi:hypothetical protein